MTYEELIEFANKLNLKIYLSCKLKELQLDGLYVDGVILINKSLTLTERKCILAEEIGHHLMNVGNILDQDKMINRKQEKLACNWAYETLVPGQAFVDVFKKGIRNRAEFAEYLQVTEEFLNKAMNYYKGKYGYTGIKVGQYRIDFIPFLGISKIEE